MINNVSFDSRFPEEISIISFDDTKKIQFESYCRADYYQLIWINEGSAVFEIDMKSVSLRTDDYICIGKEMVYKFDNMRKYHGYIVAFTDFFFSRSEQDIVFLQNARIFHSLMDPIPARKTVQENDMLSVDYMLKKYHDQDDPLRIDLIHTLLKLNLYRSETSLKGVSPLVIPDSNNIYVRDFKRLVNENFTEHKELSFYLEQLGISSKQLLSATKQLLGKNAKEVIIEKIIIEAKRLLTYSGYSVKQIAYFLGFNEPNNFSIFFHKYTGLTPITFKKNVLKLTNEKTK